MEDALIVFIVFGCIVAVVKLALDYARDKQRVRSSAGASSSLTATELKALVQEAVEDVLDERFDRLERRLEKMQKPRLIPASAEDAVLSEAKPESPPVERDRDSLL